MITEERAVELVEAQLVLDRLAQPWMTHLVEYAVGRVEEHAVGWLVFWQGVERSPHSDTLVRYAGTGPYLVDRQDGSLHFVRATSLDEDWETFYRRTARGGTDDDPLVTEIRDAAQSAGPVAAMQRLRRRYPQLGIAQAKAYVTAVARGVRPPEELVQLTRPDDLFLRADIWAVTGPAGRPLT
ncbi:YrhB family protein [Kitasatospora sp. DSM 101779]|uniref:YrhB family protein n=1 Tax=Kitasatospora sp. DSM 101779 TaxID=2853165 RepID=UPI0021D8D0A2|nr:YrhB family protein [Kitasatospora sp. DSM 101779]MCU7820939.1 YrhB family protein [Kitasatospora sp. DSM 101779]